MEAPAPRRSPSELRARPSRLVVPLLVAVLIGPTLRGASAQNTGNAVFQIVAHPLNPATSVDRRFLAQAFLKKAAYWPDGEPLRPVDLPAASETRRRFSESVLSRTVAAVKSYWQQIIFSGRGVPPPELESDEAVLRHVARFPGAIGYVSGATSVRGAKILVVK